jgi:serine kinase of HPr protein (carbohydrate metabolism regulator)
MTLRANCTAVAVEGRAILMEGPAGSGKSSLALALIDRGATLIGDDGIALEIVKGLLVAGPPPATCGKLEIRNLGIVGMECTAAPVAILLRLNDDAPRFVDRPEWIDIEGIAIPSIRLFPNASALPLRAEWALRLYGIDPRRSGTPV